MKLPTLVGCLVLAACATTSQPPSSSAPSSPSSSPSTGNLEHKMANCPTAVEAAAVKVINTADGVDITITASDPGAQERIRELSNAQAQMGDPGPAARQHTGLHGGPGKLGRCPVLHDATLVTVTPTDGGATLHVKALDPARVKQLQDETAARVTASVARQP